MKNKFIPFVAGMLLFALLAGLYLLPAGQNTGVALAAATPVSYGATVGTNSKVTFFNGNVTADTRVCFDLSNYNKVDLQWIIDQGTVNTTTLKLQWSNDNLNYEDTATVASANTADTHSGQQYNLFGQHNCVLADVANSNALGLKIFGVAK